MSGAPASSGRQAPWDEVVATTADVLALQAVAYGTANADQQRRAMWFIIKRVARTDAAAFWPGAEDGRRATDFAEGQRHVGIELRRLIGMSRDPRMPRRPLPGAEFENEDAAGAAAANPKVIDAT